MVAGHSHQKSYKSSGSGGVAPVGLLHFANEREIAGKHSGHQRLSVINGEHPNLRQAVQQRRKGGLVPRAIINARRIACVQK